MHLFLPIKLIAAAIDIDRMSEVIINSVCMCKYACVCVALEL